MNPLGYMQTPDVTPVQFVAIATAAVNSLLAFGVHLSDAQQHAILADAAIVGALLFADAHIRNGRARGQK